MAIPLPTNICDWITTIEETQCVGDSLDIINQNFVNLQEALCALYGLFPPGMIVLYSGTAAPSGWQICNGTSLSTVTYATLFNVIHYTYGGSGGTFKVPDLRGRTAIGASTTHTLATSGGTETVSLTSGQNAAHTHAVTDPGHSHTGTIPPHTHTITDPGHTHSISTSAHTHNVYYGIDQSSLTYDISAADLPGAPAARTGMPTSGQITYGVNHATSSTSVYQARHAIGPYWNSRTNSAANTTPNTYWFSSVNNGGTRLYFGDTAANFWFANVDAKTTSNPLQVTIKAEDSNVTLGAHACDITINATTVPITIAVASANITIGSTGAGDAHENMQPYLTLNYIIKLF